MKRINLLSEETSNKIAAGEVVERPASVVKELIENSIDAKSQNITIEIKESGKEYIKITDDGMGIHPEDIEKAFMPHGTSKILMIEDIYSINTFGFRGEALPSISAVSNVLLKSRTKDSDFGKEISLSGGKLNSINDTGCNIGTVIQVKDLFFNVPAREKFLKSDKRESSLISNIINRLALANHNVSFRYYNNNKKSLITFASDDVKDIIRSIYGKNIYENIMSFEEHSDIVSVYGYIGNSEISRGSRNNQSIFVNKRYIKSGIITAAVENAFKSFSTVNKFPFFVLFLEIYPEFIDVNVHPTKSEIKFENERVIYKVVFDAVHSALSENIRKSFNVEFEEKLTEVTPVQIPIDLKTKEIILSKNNQILNQLNDCEKVKYSDTYDNTTIKYDDNFNNMKNTLIYKNDSVHINEKEYNKYNVEDGFLKENTNIIKNSKYKINDDYKPQNHYETTSICNEKQEIDKVAKFPKLNVIGQFNKTYILAQTIGIFYMIDQHAAHEKILFEKFREQIKSRDVISQILLTPVVIEMSAEDFVYYLENKNIFEESGFVVEVFGDNTISIREAPMLLGKVNAKDFFLEILDNIKNMGRGSIEQVKHNMIASLACKAAIKANHPLSYAEMCVLVDELRYIEEPFNCPHGRPTIIKSTLKEIEKKFKRIQ